MLNASDVLLIFQQGTRSQVPSKFYEYLHLEKPIISISDKDSEMTDLIAMYQLGYSFEENMIKELSDYLLHLVNLKTHEKLNQTNSKIKNRYNFKNIALELQKQIEILQTHDSLR
jgi:hypothetical protein